MRASRLTRAAVAACRFVLGIVATGGGLLAGQTASALEIVPVFDATLEASPRAAEIESAVSTAIQFYQQTFTNPIQVQIEFALGTTPSSATTVETLPYDQFSALLRGNGRARSDSPVVQSALANLPGAPEGAQGSSAVVATRTNLRALGYAVGQSSGPDGVVYLDTSAIANYTGTPLSQQYDGIAAIQHEIDEVLGIGGSGSNVAGITSGRPGLGPLDLYRYGSPGKLSFTDDPLAFSYFSIDGGVSSIAFFNQEGNGVDFGDWSRKGPNACHPERVQGSICYGQTAELAVGTPEWTALQAIGYDIQAVPEPSTAALLGAGLALFVGMRRQRARLDC